MPSILLDVPDDILTRVDAEVRRRRAAHDVMVFDDESTNLIRPARPRRIKIRVSIPDMKVMGIKGREQLYQEAYDKELKINEAAHKARMAAYLSELKAFKIAASARKHARPKRPSRVRLLQEVLRLGFERWQLDVEPKPKTRPKTKTTKRTPAELAA